MTKREQIEVHEVKNLPVTLLKEDSRNTQKQSRKVFNDLKENIRTHGFDEPLLVTRNEDGETFTIRSGNHRYRAACTYGLSALPLRYSGATLMESLCLTWPRCRHIWSPASMTG